MIQFVQPIWLWAAAGIIIPVIIHLRNVREGKTLKVGSIAFLTESAKSQAKSLKLSDLLLLLLRCLLLIALTMLIAKPTWETQIKTEEKGWILIEKSQVREAYNNFKSTIDTLIKSGYTFHYFDLNFGQAKLEDVSKMPADTSKKSALSYWALLKELDQRAPSKLPVYLFSDNQLRKFTGIRPAVSLHLNWGTYRSRDSSSAWIEKAYKTANDSIHLIIGNSKFSGTYYTSQNISRDNSNTKFNVKVADEKTFVSLNDTSKYGINKIVQVDTSALAITIFTDKFEEDAHYLKAAIDAIRDFTKYKMTVSVVKDSRNIPDNYTWLFWLSEEALPESKIKNNVFLYEKGKAENTNGEILTQDEAAFSASEKNGLFKFIPANSISQDSLKTIWKDGFGEPVLSVQKQDAFVYHFYSRFNPQWNDLVWSSSFPQVIYNLIFTQEKNTAEIDDEDKRIMVSSQIQPLKNLPENNVPKQNLIDKKDLSKVFWIIAIILFFAERIISFTRSKAIVYG